MIIFTNIVVFIILALLFIDTRCMARGVYMSIFMFLVFACLAMLNFWLLI